MTLLQRTNLNILTQLRDLLDVISYEAYSCPLALLHGSSIGQHVRHSLEFYQCLFEQAPLGLIDYDARARDLRLETDARFGSSLIESLIDKVKDASHNSTIKLQTTLGEETISVETTLERELVYMAEHAIHHFAIIKIAISEQYPELTLPQDFGVAYSTIKYQNSIN